MADNSRIELYDRAHDVGLNYVRGLAPNATPEQTGAIADQYAKATVSNVDSAVLQTGNAGLYNQANQIYAPMNDLIDSSYQYAYGTLLDNGASVQEAQAGAGQFACQTYEGVNQVAVLSGYPPAEVFNAAAGIYKQALG